jgi:hypothetical protein
MKIIISENQVDKIKSKIHEYVKKYGIEQSRQIFGDKVLFTIGFNNNPMEFLNLFNDLNVVQSEEAPGLKLFRYKKGENLFAYSEKTDDVYVDYDKIWLVLKNDFGLNKKDTLATIENWLADVYQLDDVVVLRSSLWSDSGLIESTI